MKRFEKSEIIEKSSFIRDTRYGFVLTTKTNSRGKKIVSLSIRGKSGEGIYFSNYREIRAMLSLIKQGLTITKGKWYHKPKSQKE